MVLFLLIFLKQVYGNHPALKPIIGFLILLSQSFLKLFAFINFLENLLGIGAIILSFKKAFANLEGTICFIRTHIFYVLFLYN